MTASVLIARVTKTVKAHSPEILTALGIAGVVSTAYLTGKASFEAARVIDREQYRLDHFEKSHPLDNKEKVKLVWKLFIPAGASAVATVGCILGLKGVGSRRATAAATAYAIAERGFAEYRDKVVEQIGKGSEQKIRDGIAQDKVDLRPASSEVIFMGSGHVLCCDLYTGRYFRSDMESLKKAENEINQRVYSDLYVMMSEFYDLIGLPHTSQSDYVGWDSDKAMELRFSAVVSDQGEPCLAFDYNYAKPLN